MDKRVDLMTAPYLGQFITADTVGVTLGDERHIIVRLAEDGSRRIVDVAYKFCTSKRANMGRCS